MQTTVDDAARALFLAKKDDIAGAAFKRKVEGMQKITAYSYVRRVSVLFVSLLRAMCTDFILFSDLKMLR